MERIRTKALWAVIVLALLVIPLALAVSPALYVFTRSSFAHVTTGVCGGGSGGVLQARSNNGKSRLTANTSSASASGPSSAPSSW